MPHDLLEYRVHPAAYLRALRELARAWEIPKYPDGFALPGWVGSAWPYDAAYYRDR